MTGLYGAEFGVFETHQRHQNGLQAPSATNGPDTVSVSVEAALPAQRLRASFTQVPSRFRARLRAEVRPAASGDRRRFSPTPKVVPALDLDPVRCDEEPTGSGDR